MEEIDPLQSIFYTIEQTIKEYRKYAQHRIAAVIPDITLDQALVLLLINDDTAYTQKEIAELLFKDHASLTRIIELLVKNDFVSRTVNGTDRRRSCLALTKKGNQTLKKLAPVIIENRKNALAGISPAGLNELKSTLNKITNNCKK